MPIIREDGSDSQKFDNCLEFLILSGRSLAHSMMMMIPEPWEKQDMDQVKKDLLHACVMNRSVGSIAFSDGIQIGAVLDLVCVLLDTTYQATIGSFLHPSRRPFFTFRYREEGEARAGRMFLVDMEQGRIVDDLELKHQIASQEPYGDWLNQSLIDYSELPAVFEDRVDDFSTIVERQKAFGYTFEDLRFLIGPSAQSGKQPLGSMGNDSPLAVLSEKS